jgi:hypothetical protein
MFQRVINLLNLQIPKYLTTFVLFEFLARSYYALSRPIFDSGPDANNYIPLISEIGNSGYFHSGIPNVPGYPPGYALLMSIFPRVFGDNWVHPAQVFQIAISSFSILVFYKLVANVFANKYISNLSTLVFAITPAYFAMAGQAMYETLALFILLIAILILTSQQSRKNGAFFGIVAGILIIVHSRFIPIVFLLLLLNFRRTRIHLTLIALLTLIPFPMIIALRNLKFDNYFGISSLLSGSFNSVHGESICESLNCIVVAPFQSLELLKTNFLSAVHFLSPVTGSAHRGTWFHNMSIWKFLPEALATQNIQIGTAIVITGIFFTLVAYGILNSLRSGGAKRTHLILLSAPTVALMTDFFVYGDSRHKLVIFPLFLPYAIVGARVTVSKMFKINPLS